MSLIQKFWNLIKRIWAFLTNKPIEDETSMDMSEEVSEEDTMEQCKEEVEIVENEKKVNVARRTLMTELYVLEQEISVFENDFPKEYQNFMEQIESLRENYNSSLEEINKLLTFEINPELDSNKNGEVLKLSRDIKNFIKKDVKFNIISKRFQRLILKLNILYNVSIFHFEETEKQKALSQLRNALETTIQLIDEFKECDYILQDIQQKERIITLVSYVDYQIFKGTIRNSDKTPQELINNLIMLKEFEDFNYINTFKAYIKDELTDLGGLLTLISDERCSRVFRRQVLNLLTELTYSEKEENLLLNNNFWGSFLELESTLLEMLKVSSIEEDKIKVGVIARMNITVNESEVMVLPITNTYISLTSLYSITQDKKILLLIKFLKDISKDITYKEIYFLLLLFDILEIVKKFPNELFKHVEKYLKKYPYEQNTIMKKKQQLINSSNKEYVQIFTLTDYEEELIKTIEDLKIDFKVENNKVFINTFYFNELENVRNGLQNNTTNTMI